MSESNYIEKFLSLEDATVISIQVTDESDILELEIPRKEHSCPHCQTMTDKIKGYRDQTVLLTFLNDRPVYVHFRKRRYVCPHCHHSFAEPLSFVQRYQRRSQKIILQMVKECRSKQTFSDIACRYLVSVTTAIRYFDRIECPKMRVLPKVLSIDEFRGNAGGIRFQTILTDPITHDILDILPNDKTEDLIRYFLTFPIEQRKKVHWVVIDMANKFRMVIQAVFPNATIVNDRFHVTRLVLWAMERVRKRVQKEFPSHCRYLKHNKQILTKAGRSLTEYELVCLEEILSRSENLRTAYRLKESFYWVRKANGRDQVIKELQAWLEEVRQAGLAEFKSLLTSFTDWFDYIINALFLPWSNGCTEGCNNKIKVLKRISFGVRNFKRFRNRIVYLA